MASAMHLLLLLGLSSWLWMEANAICPKKAKRLMMEKEKRLKMEKLMKDCCMVCPSGWTELNSRCFMFHHDEKDWSDAEEDCIERGGNLASMQSLDDYKALRNMVMLSSGSHKQTWIGGYDAVAEGHWKWSDGTAFDFANWGFQEPNNFKKGEHCMELNFSNKDHLNDWFCHTKRSYICGRDKERVE